MALAILELDAIEGGALRFRIDTGSNRYYQLKVGRSVETRAGMKWLGDVYATTPLHLNASAGSLIDSHAQTSLPQSTIAAGKAYVQLFTFKSADGIAPSFSDVLPVGDGFVDPVGDAPVPMNGTTLAPRVVPHRSAHPSMATASSLEDLLGDIGKAAVPLVAGLLKPGPDANGGKAAGAASDRPAAAGTEDELIRLLTLLLARLGGADASRAQAIEPGVNRFASSQSLPVSHAMFAPALLALLGPLADGLFKALPGIVGPLAQNAPAALHEVNQALPLLINAINQKQMQAKVDDHKLATDTLAQVNQRMMIEDLLRSPLATTAPAATGTTGGEPAAPDAATLLALLKMLQSMPTATTPSAGAAPDVVVTKSLSTGDAAVASPSRRAVMRFAPVEPLPWRDGSQQVLYARGRDLQMVLQLVVGAPVPTARLQKAILKIFVKDDKTGVAEKTVRLKEVQANTDLTVTLAADELAKVPVDRPLTVYAEMRWLTGAGGRESTAVGTTTFVVVEPCFFKRQGEAVSPEREPHDMNRYRTFWNKLWESPVIDEAGSRRERPAQVLWELDVNARYSVLLTAERDANAVMETRLLKEKTDPDDISARTLGRLKGGIELSIASLAQVLPLWDDAPTPAPEQVAALKTADVERANTTELIYNVKLNGKAGQRGIVWVVPVFRLFEFTIGRTSDIDATGRIGSVTDETVRYPLPVAARLIGVKSEH